jgi:hypothetical protein
MSKQLQRCQTDTLLRDVLLLLLMPLLHCCCCLHLLQCDEAGV